MGARNTWLLGVVCALAFTAPVHSQDNPLRVTIEKPATVTVAARTATADQSAQRVVVHVTGFRPSKDGNVQIIVKAQMPDGTEREIGRFGLYSQAEFKTDLAGAQRYSVPLPRELAGGKRVKLTISLARPTAGTGEGAELDVGRAEIQ